MMRAAGAGIVLCLAVVHVAPYAYEQFGDLSDVAGEIRFDRAKHSSRSAPLDNGASLMWRVRCAKLREAQHLFCTPIQRNGAKNRPVVGLAPKNPSTLWFWVDTGQNSIIVSVLKALGSMQEKLSN
jgi:hypothetical protein